MLQQKFFRCAEGVYNKLFSWYQEWNGNQNFDKKNDKTE